MLYGSVSVEATREEERDRKLKKVLVKIESKMRDNRNNKVIVEATRLEAEGSVPVVSSLSS